jgi:predicted DNA-binding transcriptional regulator AlpA
MAETRTEQSSFGWTTEAEATSPASPADRAPARAVCKAKAPASGRVPRARAARATASEPELPPDNELWDVHAAAKFLKRSVSWVYHKAEDGTLPVRRLGGWGIRFIPSELRAWVMSGADDGRGR